MYSLNFLEVQMGWWEFWSLSPSQLKILVFKNASYRGTKGTMKHFEWGGFDFLSNVKCGQVGNH